MRTRYLVCVVLFAAACGKKAEEKKAPEAAPKMVEQKPKEPAASARLPVTTKSPEAKAEYEKAHELMTNLHREEARQHYKKALELDPDFAFALAELGVMTPGSEGTDLVTKAGTAAAKLSDGEKAFVDVAQAMKAGDRTKALQSLDKVMQAAPGQWEADVQAANIANMAGDPATAIAHANHALSVNKDLPQAHNLLAYAYANQRDWDKAIAAAQKQVELLPKEPNPADTLGEIQLAAGKFEDSEKSFQKALEIDPKFNDSWQGVALTRAYRGDFKGAYEALDKEMTSTEPGVKHDAMIDKAWLQFADNKLPDALKTLDAVEKDDAAKKLPVYAFAQLDRGHILVEAGKYADATKAFAEAAKRSDALAGDAKRNLMNGYRLGLLRASALQGKASPDAAKLVADAEAQEKASPDSKQEQDLLAYAHGLAAWADKGPKAALDELGKCTPQMIICRHDLATAMRKAGDKAGAEAIDKQIAETPRREAPDVYVRTHPSK
ncbi:MAG TPA: tetratricopeptide repeat protein [Kofleriaceae bacterium]|nr:tetratricopeptide repeat protein [Kofleriaceae bacterium]